MSDHSRPNRGVPFVTPKPQKEVDDELRFHLERRVQENIDRGMNPDDAGRWMRICSPLHNGTIERASLSAGTISDVRERQHSFTSLGAFQRPRDAVYSGVDDNPQVMMAMFVEPALFHTLGVSPLRGP